MGALAGGLVVAPLATEARQSARVPVVGWLSIASRTPEVSRLIDAFSDGLRELGYAEGRNLAIEYRFADGKPEQLPGFAAELIRDRVDIIVAPNPAGVRAAAQATKTVPIVMLYVADPVGSGLVASLARPGGNITGLAASASRELTGKLLELLREAAPKIALVAILRNPGNPDSAEMSTELERAAMALGVQLRMLDVRAPNDLDGAFAAIVRAGAGALLLVPDAMFFLHRARIAGLAAKSLLPTMTASSEMAEAGFLMSYGPSLPHAFRRAATFVDKILKGAKPADLPVEQPTKFELVINLKTAKALGLKIPQSLLGRADEVIQ